MAGRPCENLRSEPPNNHAWPKAAIRLLYAIVARGQPHNGVVPFGPPAFLFGPGRQAPLLFRSKNSPPLWKIALLGAGF